MIAISVSSRLPNLLDEKHFAFHGAVHVTPECVRAAFALAIGRHSKFNHHRPAWIDPIDIRPFSFCNRTSNHLNIAGPPEYRGIEPVCDGVLIADTDLGRNAAEYSAANQLRFSGLDHDLNFLSSLRYLDLPTAYPRAK